MESPTAPRATPTDEALAGLAQGGDDVAFANLVERHAAGVLAVLERGNGDHHRARDLAQETWIKVHRALPSFQLDRSFRSWLYAIALNRLRDDLRQRGRRASLFRIEPITPEVPDETHSPLEQGEQRKAIDQALSRVPDPYRQAVHLVDVMGLGYGEAAESLECTVGTVKSRVHRGRLAFQEAYGTRRDRGIRQES